MPDQLAVRTGNGRARRRMTVYRHRTALCIRAVAPITTILRRRRADASRHPRGRDHGPRRASRRRPVRLVRRLVHRLVVRRQKGSQAQGQSSHISAMSQDKLRKTLQQSGFTDIQIVDAAYIVHAKTSDGNMVEMYIDPPTSVTRSSQSGSQSGSSAQSTTGSASPLSGSGSGSTGSGSK
ncbi:PepSY domain-containing protein [Rhodoplanes sp. SY1]|uniref:PepSY domain-containing protein n=1 Tax=Rhodoplanes sp. SY1 TaxID=3166646 RepID=UPI0038B4B8A1